MSIHEHPTLTIRVRYPFPAYQPAQVVTCDFCGRSAKGTGEDPGEAAERARKEGFVTVRGEQISDPKFWACNPCSVDPSKIVPARNEKEE